jgi:uncharacterized membrane protein
LASKVHPARYGDLLSILFSGILLGCLLGLISLFPIAPHSLLSWVVLIVRLLIGLPFVLYIPGYLIQGIFFSHRSDLDPLERAGLSLGLSVASIVLLALLLNALPWGLHPTAILLGQGSLVLLLVVVTAFVRHFQPVEGAYLPDMPPHLARWWLALKVGERRTLLVMAAALIFALLTAAWIFLVPSPSQYMTEFYMLGPEGKAENFPREASLGQPITVTLGLTNRERSSMTYRVELWQVDPLEGTHRQVVAYSSVLSLDVGQTLQWSQTWQPAWSGQDQQFEFLLYASNNPEPYRQLVLWMNINP